MIQGVCIVFPSFARRQFLIYLLEALFFNSLGLNKVVSDERYMDVHSWLLMLKNSHGYLKSFKDYPIVVSLAERYCGYELATGFHLL